jgi:hypothetical protein
MEDTMNAWIKTGLSFAAALTSIVGLTQSASAVEPTDNNAPWSTMMWGGEAYIYQCGFANGGCQVASNEEVSANGDVDYFAVQCGSSNIKQVQITMANQGWGSKDLDIEVRKPNYQYVVGTSTGTGLTETVNTGAANMNSLVLKVYGYNGASNTYSILVTCY